MKARVATGLIAAAIGLACMAQAGWIQAKGLVAQVLIAAAWERTERGAPDARPWPWADTTPVARLEFGNRRSLVVLEGSSGRNLAFGPTHDPASVLPGDPGNSVIAGHRDTHFGVLEHIAMGDRLRVDRPDGRTLYFAVSDVRIVDSRDKRIGLGADSPRLTLVTCYPFDAINPGGPLRFVVTADFIAGAGNTPPRQVARAVSFSRANQKALMPVSSRPIVSW
jgi:sortase A